jgi:monofunctional glycosyltransferase
MADATTDKKPRSRKAPPRKQPVRQALRRIWRWVGRGLLGLVALLLLSIMALTVLNPPTTPYMFAEGRRLGGVEQVWVPMEQIAPAMARSAVAAEDANFCLHWGLDLTAIRAALDAGGARGASTISQQVAKNVWLWQGRSWFRKALEAGITPVMELVWTKRRVLEVYLNIAEFAEGVFGVEAAAQHYFGVSAADLTDLQAARLAAVLPDPKDRSASNPGPVVRSRTVQIMDGAATIAADGRDRCFLP